MNIVAGLAFLLFCILNYVVIALGFIGATVFQLSSLAVIILFPLAGFLTGRKLFLVVCQLVVSCVYIYAAYRAMTYISYSDQTTEYDYTYVFLAGVTGIGWFLVLLMSRASPFRRSRLSASSAD